MARQNESTSARRCNRRCLLWAALLIATYLASVTVWIRIDRYVLITRVGAEAVPTDSKRIITRTTDGKLVEIFAKPIQSPDAYVLRFSGNARAETMVDIIGRRWGNRRVEAWVMNYPGSGASDGPARLDRIGPAALAAFDALHRQAVGKPIFVDGNSFGAAVALHVAANRPIAGLMIQNPPPIRELARAKFSGPILWMIVWPISLQVPDELDSIANAARCSAPAVFIHSIHDSDVPARFQDMIINQYRGPHHEILLEGDHETQPEAAASDLADAIDWLRSQSKLVKSIQDNVISKYEAAGLQSRSLVRTKLNRVSSVGMRISVRAFKMIRPCRKQ